MAYYNPRHANYSRSKKRKFPRILRWILLIILFVGLLAGYWMYGLFFRANVWVKEGGSAFVNIPTDASWQQVTDQLYEKGLIIHRKNFEWLAKKKQYPQYIKPGHYVIRDGMNNHDLINMLRAGEQTPVRVIFNSTRTKAQWAAKMASQIEPDSITLINLLNDSAFLSDYGFEPATVSTMLIPNTYEFYWNISAEQLFKKLNQEYQNFWSEQRIGQLAKTGLTQLQAIILASIVEQETTKNDEKARIAGVYMNRLKSGWRLQADPTLIFAAGDYSIRRVLNVHKEIDSPYNTYKHTGLPPGPICIPSVASIRSVLNYEKHNYFFFCASDDLSGYHAFAKTNIQHSLNARKYRRALDRLRIRK